MASETMQSLRIAFRAAVLEQAVELGMDVREAVALIERLHVSGKLTEQADSLHSMLQTVIYESLRNHALAVVMVEQAKAEAGVSERDLNPCLVLTGLN